MGVVIIRGSTIRIENTIKDYDGTEIDVDSHAIGLYKPDGSQQGSNETTPTHDDTGEYHQDFTIPVDGSAGEWYVQWKVTKNSKDSYERIKFKVVA